MRKIVTFGGGGGQAQILCGLREYDDLDITAVCTASDSGRSTGAIRRDYGVGGYLGDVSKCMWGLSEKADLHQVMMYRFSEGSLAPHSVKNCIFTALIREYGPDRALAIMHELFGLPARFRVMPATFEDVSLSVRMGGTWVSDETYIDEIWRNPLWDPSLHLINDARLEPQAQALPAVIRAIREADRIVVCCGDLYTSVIPALLPGGIKEAVSASSAMVIQVVNLVTKPGETDGYEARDFVRQVAARIGRQPNYVVCNDGRIPQEVLDRYWEAERKIALVPPHGDSIFGLEGSLVRADIWRLDSEGHLVHDGGKTAQVLYQLINR